MDMQAACLVDPAERPWPVTVEDRSGLPHHLEIGRALEDGRDQFHAHAVPVAERTVCDDLPVVPDVMVVVLGIGRHTGLGQLPGELGHRHVAGPDALNLDPVGEIGPIQHHRRPTVPVTAASAGVRGAAAALDAPLSTRCPIWASSHLHRTMFQAASPWTARDTRTDKPTDRPSGTIVKLYRSKARRRAEDNRQPPVTGLSLANSPASQTTRAML